MRSDLYSMLLNESQKKGVSFNSLINGIAKNYNSWEKFRENIGFIPLSTLAITKIFELLDEKNIIDIAKSVGSTIPKEMVSLLHIEDDFERLSELVDVISYRFGTTDHYSMSSGYTFTIHHNVNKNFSLYVSEFFKAMGDSLALSIHIINQTSSIVVFNLEDSSIYSKSSKKVNTKIS